MIRRVARPGIAALALAIGCATAGQRVSASVETTSFAPEMGINLSEMTRLPSGVYIKDLTVGTGTVAAREMDITVRYVAFLTNGRQANGSLDAPPVPLHLTTTGVIRGWYDGIPGMKVGGMRRLIIPPDLGYGSRDHEAIPANSVLVFDVILVSAR